MILASLALIAVQAAPLACPAGLAAVAADGSVTPLPLTKAAQRKIGITGATFLIGKIKVKSVWAGPSAATRVLGPRPAFRLCAAAPAEAPNDYVGVDAAPTTPADLRLVRFQAGKDSRELPVASSDAFGGGKDRIGESVVAVEVERPEPGVTVLRPARDLAPGQYGFLRRSAPGKGAVDAAYDFTVE